MLSWPGLEIVSIWLQSPEGNSPHFLLACVAPFASFVWRQAIPTWYDPQVHHLLCIWD